MFHESIQKRNSHEVAKVLYTLLVQVFEKNGGLSNVSIPGNYTAWHEVLRFEHRLNRYYLFFNDIIGSTGCVYYQVIKQEQK